MDMFVRLAESFFVLIATLIGKGLGLAGEKLAEKAVPATRVADIVGTSRRTRGELDELSRISARLRVHTGAAEKRCEALCQRVVDAVAQRVPGLKESPLEEKVRTLCWKLLADEGYCPVPDIAAAKNLSIGEIWELKKTVRRQIAFFESPQAFEKVENIIFEFALAPFCGVAGGVRQEANGATFSMPLYNLNSDVAQSILLLYGVLSQDCDPQDGDPFPKLWKQYANNMAIASGMNPEEVEKSGREPTLPTEAKDKSAAELVESYLAKTPFLDIYKASVPFTIPVASRFSHMHIVAGSGHGKTKTAQSLILSDLPEVKAGKRTVIVIDSQGDMIKTILNLPIVGELSDRLVLIDPNDVDTPPALNLFDFGLERLGTYNAVEREKLINGAVALYEYLFGALLGAELTQKQGVIFSYLALLMMVVPGATIHTLMDFMKEPELIRPYLKNLDDPISVKFFESEFFSPNFDNTRQQILNRLWGVLRTRSIARMFGHRHNKLNLFEAMNRGSLILINTAKDLLKQDGCEIFGRFFIALIAQATQERAAIHEKKRMDTFVYIDEAHDYFDENIEMLLATARKYRVGIALIHQFLGQFDRRLQKAVETNTAIKLVGGLSNDDARAFANEMGCDTAFLRSMRKNEKEKKTEFACMVKDYTSAPVRITVPLDAMERLPRLDPAILEALKEGNRKRYCADLNGQQSDTSETADAPPTSSELI